MTTTTALESRQSALNKSNLNDTADLLAVMRAGDALSVIKVVVAGATTAASQVITSLDVIENSTITGFTPALVVANGDRLPAIGQVVTLRITAGTANTGPSLVTDVGGTPTDIAALAASVVTLSDDGTTLLFDAAVTGFVLTYIPRAVGVESTFPTAAP